MAIRTESKQSGVPPSERASLDARKGRGLRNENEALLATSRGRPRSVSETFTANQNILGPAGSFRPSPSHRMLCKLDAFFSVPYRYLRCVLRYEMGTALHLRIRSLSVGAPFVALSFLPCFFPCLAFFPCLVLDVRHPASVSFQCAETPINAAFFVLLQRCRFPHCRPSPEPPQHILAHRFPSA